ncbi:MAG TPA: hypothetical protein VJT49_32310 [Amycolatopsis sp.]|uniref:hypothetical protein n=1 Tax=Amycolatopsis sp. TaxID=37632 RepID=UPI002B476045|nr:hypothetical protein [Amycolatopsis sp.]HKS49707.1 hypothetical protein [Amycolatopsis sp.]
MTGLLLFLTLILLAGIAAALERNHRRQWPTGPAGSVNFEDRDEVRVWQELHTRH